MSLSRVNTPPARMTPKASQEYCADLVLRMLAAVDAGDRAITDIDIECLDVETTLPGAPARTFSATGIQVWKIVTEPRDPVAFTKQDAH